jgi:VanZ family protein
LLKYLEERKTQLVYTPLVIYWLILLGATSFPTNSIPSFGVSDKLLHLGAYFGLGILLNLTFVFQNKYSFFKKQSAWYTILIGSLYGVLDEFHQHFVPGRSMEFLDFLADFVGLVLAVVLVIYLMRTSDFVPK